LDGVFGAEDLFRRPSTRREGLGLANIKVSKMWPGTNEREDDDTSKGPEAPLTVKIPSRRHPNSELTVNHTKTFPISPKSTAAEPQGRGQKPRLWASDVHNDFVPLQGHDGLSSWSASSEKQLGSPGSAFDRVFPIRSVVSVDSSQTPYTVPGRNSSEQQDYFPPAFGTNDLAGGHQPRRGHRQSFSEADGRSAPTPRRQQPSRLPGERTRGDRKLSNSTAHNGLDRYGGGTRMELFSDATSDKSNEMGESLSGRGTIQFNSLGSQTLADEESISELLTARFKHIVTAEGHAVITGHDGKTLQRCEDEP
jgi:hypothetical protein